jgi:S-formylglutathione hydrolase FrmB
MYAPETTKPSHRQSFPSLLRFGSSICLLGCAGAIGMQRAEAQIAPSQAGIFEVKADGTLPGPISGRLILFMKHGHGDTAVDEEEFRPGDTWIAAQEVHDLAPGATVKIDANLTAYPEAFTKAAGSDWEIQAVLDVDHTYNYSGRDVHDWESPVVAMGSGALPTIVLDRHPEAGPREAATTKLHEIAGEAELFDFKSEALSRFWGKPTDIRAWVILPPGYDAKAKTKYPTAYWTHGFGGNLQYSLATGMNLRKRMEDKKMPPMIWVMLDESIPQGTHEFADSVNNGPWGTALTTEFIPAIERKYDMDSRPSGRLLNGHSSGGWATLQLQVNYPNVFGGTWSTSPDPSDFHNFTGSDLYAPHANVYHGSDGMPTPIMRADGKVVATFEQFSKIETVLGPYGGQVSSFNWVFSPKSPSGAPEPMFDRVTGDVYPGVVQYWHDHYDLAHLVEQNWAQNGPMLRGRIHLFVGTADTFYLEGSAHLFEARLQKLGAEPHFTYIPGRSHCDLYKVGADRSGLFNQIGAEMYATARPNAHWRSAQ